MLSNYHGENHMVEQHSPFRAAQSKWAQHVALTRVAGVPDTATNDTSGIPAAVAAAKAADIAIVFVGLTPCNGWSKQVCVATSFDLSPRVSSIFHVVFLF